MNGFPLVSVSLACFFGNLYLKITQCVTQFGGFSLIRSGGAIYDHSLFLGEFISANGPMRKV